ncbi:bacillithiol system redox-active protein YtxJ [Paenibacillus tarimensis]
MTMKIRPLVSVEEWNEALKASEQQPLLVFKHSTRCPVSSGAHDELMNFLEDARNPKFYAVLVRVIEERPVSNTIAEGLGLQHASPQAILIEDGKVTWYATHWDITYSVLEEQLGEHCEK